MRRQFGKSVPGTFTFRVMLGASWATPTQLIRRSFRNWFQPHYPFMFATFRCAHDK